MTKAVFFFCLFAVIHIGFAQGVGVNETGQPPHPSAIFDASSTSKGMLPPRMTTSQRNAIQNPAVGLMVFNTSTNCVDVFYGTFWQSIHCGCSHPPTDVNYTDNGPITYCVNQTIPVNIPTTQGGTPSSYTISPALPTGLLFNTTSGYISGTPAVAGGTTEYTISANNACGSSNRVLQLTILSAPSAPTVIDGSVSPTVNTSVGYSISAIAGSTTYSWSVPAGWVINSGQGTAAIQVTAGANAGNVSVTVSNSCGNASISKAVTPWRPITATGGTTSTYTANGTNGINGIPYRVHSFTSSGTSAFTVTDAGSSGQLDYLIVAGGGGGGGAHAGGGGGAGGVLSGLAQVIGQNYSVVVGNGGMAGNETTSPTSGQPSSAFGMVSNGGGAGGRESQFPGNNGGSGGGGAGDMLAANRAPGSGTTNQGNAGGAGSNNVSNNYGLGGGGGGASTQGSPANANQGGDGGNGVQSAITGTPLHYGGGGGGGGWGNTGKPGGNGGLGGGGNGASSGQFGQNGTANRGGGGGGSDASAGSIGRQGGSGGSGIVVIRYPLTNPNP